MERLARQYVTRKLASVSDEDLGGDKGKVLDKLIHLAVQFTMVQYSADGGDVDACAIEVSELRKRVEANCEHAIKLEIKMAARLAMHDVGDADVDGLVVPPAIRKHL